jgi:3-hydroxyisobutyrate dehydrogenase-like beta-hydroxyacid dehydrogenase
MMAASGGSNSMSRVHQYATNNRTIDYNFKTNLLIKDMEIGLSMFDNQDKDPVFAVFKEIKKIYKDCAQPNWENSDIFDLYSFIENK